MSPYAKTRGSTGNFGGYSTEGERLRHITTTRSKRSVYRQPKALAPQFRPGGILDGWAPAAFGDVWGQKPRTNKHLDSGMDSGVDTSYGAKQQFQNSSFRGLGQGDGAESRLDSTL